MPIAASESRRSKWVADGKPHPGRRMTEAEFVAWADEDTRAEWVDGEVVIMPPVSDEHDDFAWWLRTLLQDYADARELGRAKGPEFTVRLGRERRRRCPDVLFVSKSREEMIRPRHVEGAPDLIVELVSVESLTRDWREKYLEYEKGGVREYLVVDRQAGRVELYRLGRNRKYVVVPDQEGKLVFATVPGFFLRVKWLLAARPPSRIAVLKELGIKA